jgi:hypothetical protein
MRRPGAHARRRESRVTAGSGLRYRPRMPERAASPRGPEVPDLADVTDAAALLQDGFVHLNAHDQGTLPCLCKRCLDPALDRAVVSGTEFALDHAVAHGRVLFYWLPVSLAGSRAEVRRNVVARLRKQLSPRDASTP